MVCYELYNYMFTINLFCCNLSDLISYECFLSLTLKWKRFHTEENLSSAPSVVKMITSGDAVDGNLIKMRTFLFQ